MAGSVRRATPIACYVGPNGGGKTLAMVHDTLPSLDAGRTVLSTVPLFSVPPKYRPEHGPLELHPCYVPLSSWRQLVAAEHCDVLMDEVTGVASSRSYSSLPAQLLNMLMQLRKRDVVLRWTSPNYSRADVVIREVTRTVTVCRGYWPKRVEGSAWPSRRLFTWATFDAVDFDAFETAKSDQLKKLARQAVWRRPSFRAQHAYNTLDAVSTLDHIDVFGSCLECGGKRTQHRCTCPAHHEQPAEAGPAGRSETDEDSPSLALPWEELFGDTGALGVGPSTIRDS